MRSYQHSRVFDAYKGTKEKIKENWTSLEYLQTLDYLLWEAIAPIHTECPSLFNNYLAKVVAWQTIKASTKFTSDDRSILPVRLFNMLTADSLTQAHEKAKELRMNRGVLFGFLTFFLSQLRRYERLQSPLYDIGQTERLSEIAAIERALGLRRGGNLYAALQQVKYWEEEARSFKSMIVEKYTRMALMHAKSTYQEYNHSVPLDDIIQIYMMTVNRAIDRCDARNGVLTTFITSWFKSARSEVGELAKGQNNQSYEGLTEEHGDAVSDILGFAVPDESMELYEHLAFVAKEVDPEGILRGPMGFPEFVPYAERQVLLNFVVDA